MEINTKNSSGMMNGLPPSKRDDRKVGPIVGALVVILIIIVVILYFFGKRLNTQSPVNTTADTNQSSLTTKETATTIETDINSINTQLDSQLKDIDYSF